jgi:death-on-curing protein
MKVFLLLNGFEISASEEEQEEIVLQITSGVLAREGFTAWLSEHMIEKRSSS